MTNLERFDKLMKEAGAIGIDNESLLTSWDYVGIKDHEDGDEIFAAYWNDDEGLQFETHLTKKGIEEGHFTTDAFICKDENEDKTRIQFYAVKNLIGE